MGLFTNSDGCRTYYELSGDPRKPLLVLAHSMGCDHRMWTPQRDQFANQYYVMSYDIRGHGESDAPTEDYTIERLGSDLLELIDATGREQFSFCGVSLGGMIGQWIAASAPARVDKLVLANTAAALGTAEYWNERIHRITSDGMTAVAPSIMKRWFSVEFQRKRPEVVNAFERALCHMPQAGYLGCCAAVRDLNLVDVLPLIRAHTLIICGKRDVATPPEMSAQIAARVAAADIANLDAAHLSNIEAASDFTRTVMSFLEP